jgi:hypothetical protein
MPKAKKSPDVYEIPYRINQPVKIGATDKEIINAVIIGICIAGPDEITYNCAWVHSGKRETQWVTKHEIRGTSNAIQTIAGFRTPHDEDA